MRETWRIKLFGWLRAERGGEVVSRFPTQKAAALLAVLAFRSGQPMPREVLTEMLWPEAEPEAARNRFRVTLSALRRILEKPGDAPGSVLIADRSTVQLNPAAIVTDVHEFEAALAAASAPGVPPAEVAAILSRAVELCPGDLLSGFYEDWITPERERLCVDAMEAWRRLAAAREACGDVSGALEAARRAIALDPLCEPAHQHVMALHLAAGEPSAALRQYRDLRRILRRALGQPPSPETRALFEAISARMREAPAAPSVPPKDERLAPSGEEPAVAPVAARPEPPRAARPANHLPVLLTRFIGREAEVKRLEALLGGGAGRPDTMPPGGPERHVTLTGPGGSGKTRLALEAAARLESAYAGAVWFVSLAELDDPRLLADAIFDAMRLRRIAALEPMEQVVAAIGSRPSLLVLDNFEQLAEGGALIVRDLLQRAPALRCLVTSQVRLQIAGEREVPVAPLAVPNGTREPDALAACPSVRLFIDRAQSVCPEFRVTGRNAEAVAALCRRLEGIPLAIELAAAWAHTLTPAQMLERLSRRFDLLVARRQDVFARHRALRTALDWSFRLLSPDLQRFFARLSVFRNGWTLEAAQEVTGEPEALAHLATLRERSLLQAEDDGEEMRFSMLETLHEYAAEQLSDDERRDLAGRHAAYYLHLAEGAEAAVFGSDAEAWLDRLVGQHDNLRAALDFSLGPDGDLSVAARLATALAGFWEFRGHFQEGRRYLARALGGEAPGAALSARDRMRTLNVASRLCVCQGDGPEGDSYAVEALALARALADRREEALALRNRAFAAYIRADFEASVTLQEESLALFRGLSDTWGLAATLDDMASALARTGEYARARACFEESLGIYTRMGQREGIASATFGLGVLARDLGDMATAQDLLVQCLSAGRDMKDTLLIALSVNALGTIAALSGDTIDGRVKLEESIILFRELRDSRGLFFALYHLGMCVERCEDTGRAEGCLREALALAHGVGDRRYTLYSLDGLGMLAADREDTERAIRLIARAEAYREELGVPWPPYQCADREKTIEAIRAALPPDRFGALWAEGAALPVEEAIRFGLSYEPRAANPGREAIYPAIISGAEAD